MERAVTILLTLPQILWGILLSIYYGFETLYRWINPQAFEKSIKNDIILITGAGSGIGRLMALKLAKLGAIIVSWDVNATGNKETIQLIKAQGGTAYAYTVDLCKKEAIYEAAAKTKQEVGVVKILVNNAGIVSGASLLETPDEKIIRTFDVNVLAHFWTIKAFLPDMIKNESGHIVNIASLAGYGGMPKVIIVKYDLRATKSMKYINGNFKFLSLWTIAVANLLHWALMTL